MHATEGTSFYDALTLCLNVVQTCFLAWLAARYRR